MTKSNLGRFFEDFHLGEKIAHATPRTVTPADRALNIALTGSRYALLCADPLAQACGLKHAPIDPLLAFHIVFGLAQCLRDRWQKNRRDFDRGERRRRCGRELHQAPPTTVAFLPRAAHR